MSSDGEEAALSEAGVEEEEDREMKLIIQRLEAAELPWVLPGQQSALEESEAERLASFVLGCDAVELQAYLDEEFRLYRQSLSVDTASPEISVRAAWARDSYYTHVKEFELVQQRAVTVFDSLVALVRANTVAPLLRAELLRCLRPVPPSSVSALRDHVDLQWRAAEEALPSFLHGHASSVRSMWFADNILRIVRDFVETSVFFPALAAADFPSESQRAEASALYKLVLPLHVRDIQARVDEEVSASLGSIPESVGNEVRAAVRKSVLLEKYLPIVASIVRRVADIAPAWAFVPAVSPASLNCPTLQEEAMQLIPQVTEVLAAEIESRVAQLLDSVREKLPVSSRPTVWPVVQEQVLKAEYFSVVKSVVSEADCRRFVPKVLPEMLETEAARLEAFNLLKLVKVEHETLIADGVQAGLTKMKNSLPGSCGAAVEAELEAAWLRDHYYGVVAGIVMTGTPTSRTVASSSREGFSGALADAMFTSPQKKRRSLESTASEAVLRSWSVAELQQVQEQGLGEHNELECFLLFVPGQPRLVQAKATRRSPAGQVAVITVVLADRTGPICMDLWRDAAEALLRDVESWQHDAEGPWLVHISNFALRGDSRVRSATPYLKLVSVDKTCVRRLAQPTKKWLSDSSVHCSPLLFTRDFGCLEQAVPFRVSLAGIVRDVSPISESQNGNPMRSFKLQDVSGRYVFCQVLGRHAEHPALEALHEVVLYFAMAQAALSHGPGQLWVYDDCHILSLSSNATASVPRTLVALQGAA